MYLNRHYFFTGLTANDEPIVHLISSPHSVVAEDQMTEARQELAYSGKTGVSINSKTSISTSWDSLVDELPEKFKGHRLIQDLNDFIKELG